MNPFGPALCGSDGFAFGVVPPLVTRGKDERLSIGEGLTDSRSFLPRPALATPTALS